MTTKDQERAALAKIRKIVEGLGEDSYIAMAFEGCFDDAEYNIENDFANSYKGRYERCLKEALDIAGKVKEAERRTEAVENELELAKKTIQDEVDRANRLRESVNVEHETRNEWNRLYNEKAAEAVMLEKKADALQLENMKLKAKLYDMMTATA